jgi:hypothetical protein
MGKLPISMAILNSYVSLSEGIENLVIWKMRNMIHDGIYMI